MSLPGPLYGVEQYEGNNNFAFVNLRTGEHSEWRFCKEQERVPIYPGYLLSKMETTVRDGCDVLPDGIPYVIVRGKHSDWLPYIAMVGDDGADRPVLARNCHNTLDDKDTACTGGEAKFTQEKP